MVDSSRKVALVVGASRGLGRAIVEELLRRNWSVIATVRRSSASALSDLKAKWLDQLDVEVCDIVSDQEVDELKGRLSTVPLDLLFINAGVSNDRMQLIGDVSTEDFVKVMVTNSLAPMRFLEKYWQMVKPAGSVALMSSKMASIALNETGEWEAYRASKAALNTIMRSFAARHSSDPRTYLLIAPGWIRTELGGSDAPLSMEEAIPKVLNVVESCQGQGGLRYVSYLGEQLPW